MKSQSLINIVRNALRVNPSLGELPAMPVFIKIRSFLKAGMTENEVISELTAIRVA